MLVLLEERRLRSLQSVPLAVEVAGELSLPAPPQLFGELFERVV